MQMDANLKTGIWRQFGAVIDYLGATIRACPDHLWLSPLWVNPNEQPGFAQFWYRAYHTLFWLDVYLYGTEEGFLPPEPFALIEQDDGAWVVPERAYTKDGVLSYLDYGREKCRSTIEALTGDTLQRRHVFGWGECSFLELLIFNLRHVQEHAAQLNLFLGQQGVDAPNYRTRLREETG